MAKRATHPYPYSSPRPCPALWGLAPVYLDPWRGYAVPFIAPGAFDWGFERTAVSDRFYRRKELEQMAKVAKGTPTDTNIYALVEKCGHTGRASARVEASAAPHIKRCIAAGLAEVLGADVVLTEAGRAVVDDYKAKWRGRRFWLPRAQQ